MPGCLELIPNLGFEDCITRKSRNFVTSAGDLVASSVKWFCTMEIGQLKLNWNSSRGISVDTLQIQYLSKRNYTVNIALFNRMTMYTYVGSWNKLTCQNCRSCKLPK